MPIVNKSDELSGNHTDETQKDTSIPALHHAIACSNWHNLAEALAPENVLTYIQLNKIAKKP